MTKREKRRFAVLVKTAWTKEWLTVLNQRDFEILYGVSRSTVEHQARVKLTDEQLRQARLLEREAKRRQQIVIAA